jgi:hypothetical protein
LHYTAVNVSLSIKDQEMRAEMRFLLSKLTLKPVLVPGAGIEPAQPQWPQDFKSCVSTNSTIRAENNPEISGLKKKSLSGFFLILQIDHLSERETRLELATPTLARSCSTN